MMASLGIVLQHDGMIAEEEQKWRFRSRSHVVSPRDGADDLRAYVICIK